MQNEENRSEGQSSELKNNIKVSTSQIRGKKVKTVSKVRKSGGKGKWIAVIAVVLAAAIGGGLFLMRQPSSSGSTGRPSSGNTGAGTLLGGLLSGNTPAAEEAGRGYSISTSNQAAAEAGAAILDAGGNAVDAAIAISYALSVAEPFASGLGGGGCMVVYDPATQDYVFYNYASQAPSASGVQTILVPGMVSGMEKLMRDMGTMDAARLLQPALDLCDGLEVDEVLAKRLTTLSPAQAQKTPFFGENDYLAAGDVIVQPELKATLQAIIDGGAQAFYTGTIAEGISASSAITMEDLAGYQTIVEEPVVGTYDDYTVASAAAPYSGVSLIQMLQMAEMLDTPSPEEDGAVFLQDLKKITQAVMTDRADRVYDLRFGSGEVVQSGLVTEAYIADLCGMELLDYIEDEECEDTTGFTVIDKDGMVVACTNTLSSWFGSERYTNGFFLNNSGTLFGSGVNAYEPGKRPRSHISPTVLVSEEEAMAIASPGGHVIFRILANVLLDVCEFDTAPQAAVDKQRLFFMNGNTIYYEIGYETPLFAKVAGMGYPVVPYSSHTYFGNVALCGYEEGEGYYSASDIRRNGYAIAVNR